MTLAPGVKLGPFTVNGVLGSGGMGEVYRAHDERLRRDVAIKVLPEKFSKDADRLRRFEQEARAAGVLNHPNILAIYDIGTHDGSSYVVSELLEGETLRDALDRGSIGIRRSIEYAAQIASGLTAAHDKGIVHRDLKPENLFITNDGRIKILDFGLAKLTETEDINRSALPTLASVTDPGVVLGTVGYMSPEQVRGASVDHRSDIFSFGAILYEMLSGHRAFLGDSAVEMMSAILKEEPPDLTAQHADIPSALDRIVRRCLEKQRDRRFRSASDLGFALETVSSPSGPGVIATTAAAEVRQRWVTLPWVVAAIAIAAAALTLLFRGLPTLPAGLDPIFISTTAEKYLITPPEISPDGRWLAYVGLEQGKRVVWLRQMDHSNATVIPGSEDSDSLFWFSDSQSLGILTHNELRKFLLTGGPPQLIAKIPSRVGGFAGAATNDSGVVIYNAGFAKGTLFRTGLNGGAAVPITALDAQRQETSHLWPQFLPDGRHFIYLALSHNPENNAIYAGSLDSTDRVFLLKATVRALFSPPGFILFVRDNALMAQGFDPVSLQLKGEAKQITSPVGIFAGLGAAAMTVSRTGIVGYSADFIPISETSQIVWFDRLGKQIGTIGNPGSYWMLNLSADGKKIAICLRNPSNKNFDIWIADVARGTMSPLITDPSGDFDPEWSPDGRVAFSSDRDGITEIFEKSTTGVGSPKPVVQASEPSSASDWSADGRFILYHQGQSKLLAIDTIDRKSTHLLDSPSVKDQARFSPDGRWVAYNADDSGTFEVYVLPFPAGGRPIQVSTSGGVQPRWRRDGKEMFYLAPDGKMMVVETRSTSSSSIEFGVPKTLFQTGLNPPDYEVEQYDVTADGQRFIVITPPAEPSHQFNFLINWTSLIKK